MTDSDLLRSYADDGSNAAFANLVERHLDLVYSVARRHVQSSALAEDVAQSVFIELARQARRIKAGTPLAAWLHLVSRRMAINAARGEIRRQARENAALELAAMKPDCSSNWDAIEPLLDEAVEALNAADRSAILLRFFENKSLREIGAALGFSEDAAQKRVTRALEQLRTLLVRRGLTLTAAGLATDLSAHAIHTAPTALGTSIAAGTAALGAATFQVTAVQAARTIAMTTLQKSAVSAALVLALGAGVYEAVGFARQKSELVASQQRTFELTAQLQHARAQQVTASLRLKSVETQIDERIARAGARLSSGDAALEAQMKTWLANVDRLKEILEQHPNLRIPELKLLSEDDWFNAAVFAQLDSDDAVRQALSKVRQMAENVMGNKVRSALSGYLKSNGGVLPASVDQLLPFFDPPIEPAFLERYEMLQSGKFSDVPTKNQMGLVGVKTPIDVEYDSSWKIGVNGFITTGAMTTNVIEAKRAFSAANSGQKGTTAAQLLPYLKWPVSEAALEKYLIPPAKRARNSP